MPRSRLPEVGGRPHCSCAPHFGQKLGLMPRPKYRLQAGQRQFQNENATTPRTYTRKTTPSVSPDRPANVFPALVPDPQEEDHDEDDGHGHRPLPTLTRPELLHHPTLIARPTSNPHAAPHRSHVSAPAQCTNPHRLHFTLDTTSAPTFFKLAAGVKPYVRPCRP